MFDRKIPIADSRGIPIFSSGENDAIFDNLLIQQKDFILKLINNEAYSEAFFALLTVGAMWETLSYGYKYNELMERIYASGYPNNRK